VNPEYTPEASQCQISTAEFGNGAQVFESTSAMRSFTGTPGFPSVIFARSFSSST
jgi:hypothetical protein